ncbi:LRR domain containing protein [Parasponia andersonii]|uniref:LRR domain containing protein n=1 Tax=Parasponia andersonii TaxID=3476 RepID=A0A2P5C485_PARAD|nr:LRR domain containing protein [Parasponia andersonii]
MGSKLVLFQPRGVRFEKGIGCLRHLRTLMTADALLSSFGERELENLRQLRRLGLSRLTAELHGLKLVEIEEGALPCLEELTIASNPLLNVVPSGVQHLKNLKILANFDMPTEFVLSMNPDGGSKYWKVEHISSVHFWYRVEGGRNYTLYKLGEPQLLDHLQGLASNIYDVTQREFGLSLFNHNG